MSPLPGTWRDVLCLAAGIARPFETLRLEAYHDPVGFPTQGYGRLLSREKWADLSKWPPISEAVAEAWLEEDLAKAFASVLRLIPRQLTARQLAALVDFAFNLGAGNLQASTLRRLVLRGELGSAADEFQKWNKAAGRVLKGLTRRRKAERALWLSAAKTN